MYSDSNAIYWTTPYMLLPGSKLEVNANPAVAAGGFHASIVPLPATGARPPIDVLDGPPINQSGFCQGDVIIRAYVPGSRM